MPDLPTRAQLFQLGADEVLARSEARPPTARVSPEQVYTEGSDINIVIASASAMAEEVLRQLARRTKALFLDGAEDEDLDRLVADRFSSTIPRKAATPSVGIVTVTRTVPGLAVTLPVATVLRATNGAEFLSTAPIILQSGSAGPASGPVVARVAGTEGNVAAGQLNAFSVPPPDPTMLVTNAEAMAGGDVRESDARYRARARDFFRSVRRGTVGAIEFGALTVPGVRQAVVVEETDINGDQTGRVSLYIADANGQANAALAQAVRDALFEYRAAGIVVDVFSAIPTFVSIVLRLQFAAGIDSLRAFDIVRQAVVSRVNALRPRETLYRSTIESAARSVQGVIVPDDAVVVPVGDLVPSGAQVIRTRTDLVVPA